ncbi:MAG: hypothetical protein H0Z24_06820 [Thermosipho sp. (in: Bacteria)]|nr:hypothetical protein [Thermosipho sp. (in: thermotogales)]
MLKEITEIIKEKISPKKVLFKEELVDFVKKEFEKRQQERLPLELQWRLNIEFYNGNQYQEINYQTKTVEEVVKLYWWQEREVFNQIAPIVETRLAKLARLRPIPKVRPATNTIEDISNAKVANKLIESTYHEQEMKDKQLTANVWSELTGTAIYKVVWNKNKGRKIGTLIENENVEDIYEGDINTLVISPFEIYPDSIWNENPEDCKSIIHAKAYHVDEIYEKWGVKVEGREVTAFTIQGNSIGIGGLGNRVGGQRIITQKKKNHQIVYEYWEMPTKEHKEGRLIICTDTELLYYGKNPYRVNKEGKIGLPFITQKCILIAGCFFGKSVIERLIPIQRRYNALKNRKAEYLNRASIGQIVYEEGSVDPDLLEEEAGAPGALIPYNRHYNPPRYMEYHGLPAEFTTEENALLNDFNRISGVSEISRDSSAPTGVNSGVALSILQEQDDTRLSLTASYVAKANIKLGKIWIRLYKQFADIPRVLRYVGEDNSIEVIEWDRSMLTSEDVYIDAHSISIESLAQRRQMVFDLLSAGLFNDPETGRITKEGRAKILEMIQLGNWESADDETKLQIAAAERENRKMIEGQMVNIQSYHDDLIHIKRHTRFRLTNDYEMLVEKNPEIHQIFEYHIQMHLENLNNKAQQINTQEGE